MEAEVDATFGLMHAFPTVGTAGRMSAKTAGGVTVGT